MKKYRDHVSDIERNLTGGKSFEGLLWSDQITLGEYNTAESIKNSYLREKEAALQRHNANATITVTYLPTYELTDAIIGVIVYNQKGNQVLQIAVTKCLQYTKCEFEMLKIKTYEESTLDHSESRSPKGKVVNFEGIDEELPVKSFDAFINHLRRNLVNITDICPANVPEDDWKYLIFQACPRGE